MAKVMVVSGTFSLVLATYSDVNGSSIIAYSTVAMISASNGGWTRYATTVGGVGTGAALAITQTTKSIRLLMYWDPGSTGTAYVDCWQFQVCHPADTNIPFSYGVGKPGEAGPAGAQGTPGSAGAAGSTGATGPSGVPGPPGSTDGLMVHRPYIPYCPSDGELQDTHLHYDFSRPGGQNAEGLIDLDLITDDNSGLQISARQISLLTAKPGYTDASVTIGSGDVLFSGRIACRGADFIAPVREDDGEYGNTEEGKLLWDQALQQLRICDNQNTWWSISVDGGSSSSHTQSASTITQGTFGSGNYTFPGNVTLSSSSGSLSFRNNFGGNECVVQVGAAGSVTASGYAYVDSRKVVGFLGIIIGGAQRYIPICE
jgi:hypothetical protein